MTRPIIQSLLILATGLAVVQPSHAFLDKLLKSKTETKDGDAKMDLPKKDGPKHALGVIDFTNEAGWRGRWELGRNLGIMLESALYDSGQFTIVDRSKISKTMAEQDLQNSGRTAKAGGVAQTGKIRSARYLATGAITTVEENTQGTGGGFRIKGIRIGASGSKATVVAIIKLIDSTTSEVVAKKRVEGKAGRKALNFGFRGADFGTDIDSFNKTPIGSATQDVINQAVEFLVQEFKQIGFTVSIIKVTDGGRVIINRGESSGIMAGTEYIIEEKGEELLDPETGEILGREEGRVIARIKVDKVLEKLAYCSVVEGEPQAGAVAKLAP